MATSKTSFGRFTGKCLSCGCKDANNKGRCPKCGAMVTSSGKVFFKKGVQAPVEPVGQPVAEPVKKPVEPVTGYPSVSPSKKGETKNGQKKPVKSPSKARVEPVSPVRQEPVRARENNDDYDPYWI